MARSARRSVSAPVQFIPTVCPVSFPSRISHRTLHGHERPARFFRPSGAGNAEKLRTLGLRASFGSGPPRTPPPRTSRRHTPTKNTMVRHRPREPSSPPRARLDRRAPARSRAPRSRATADVTTARARSRLTSFVAADRRPPPQTSPPPTRPPAPRAGRRLPRGPQAPQGGRSRCVRPRAEGEAPPDVRRRARPASSPCPGVDRAGPLPPPSIARRASRERRSAGRKRAVAIDRDRSHVASPPRAPVPRDAPRGGTRAPARRPDPAPPRPSSRDPPPTTRTEPPSSR